MHSQTQVIGRVSDHLISLMEIGWYVLRWEQRSIQPSCQGFVVILVLIFSKTECQLYVKVLNSKHSTLKNLRLCFKLHQLSSFPSQEPSYWIFFSAEFPFSSSYCKQMVHSPTLVCLHVSVSRQVIEVLWHDIVHKQLTVFRFGDICFLNGHQTSSYFNTIINNTHKKKHQN